MKKVFLILIIISTLGFSQGILESLGLLKGLNILPKNATIKVQTYYKNFFGQLKLTSTDGTITERDLIGAGIGVPLATNTYLEADIYSGAEELETNSRSSINYGYSISIIGHYPILKSTTIFLRYGWTDLKLEDNNIQEDETDSFDLGYGVEAQLLHNIKISYERRDFPLINSSTKAKANLFSILINF